MDLDERRRLHSKLSNRLAHLDADELGALVDREPVQGWGASQGTIVGDEGVFVKRVPLTRVEHERLFSTKNHFRLPLYYQYGVGSAGFGACRELVTHLKTTNWVVDGSCRGFPMLLHHRIVPRRARNAAGANPDSWIAGGDYVRYWGGSKRIGSYIAERAAAPYELWLVLEWVPHTLHDWAGANQPSVARVLDELLATVAFLRSNGVVHFDAHWGNVVVSEDGSPRLTDFGLANDSAFHLSDDEREFLSRHEHYDFGEAIYGVGSAMVSMVGKLEPEARQALIRRYVPPERLGSLNQDAAVDLLVRNVDDLVSAGELGLGDDYASLVRRFADVILFMNSFFAALRADRRKRTYFDDGALRGLLVEAGVDV